MIDDAYVMLLMCPLLATESYAFIVQQNAAEEVGLIS